MIKIVNGPDYDTNKYSFSQGAKYLDLRSGGKKLGRNGLMLILKKCNMLNYQGIAYAQFVEEGYFINSVKIHESGASVRYDEYTIINGGKGLDFVKEKVVNYLVDKTPPFPPPPVNPYSGQMYL